MSSRIVGWIALGLVVGVLVGAIFRPSYLLIGQLPLGVVLTRGEFLTGGDVLLRPQAEESFNQMVLWTVVGGIVFGVIGTVMSRRRAVGDLPRYGHPMRGPYPAAQFCSNCGRQLPSDATFCDKCGIRLL